MINIYQYERKVKQMIDSERSKEREQLWLEKYNGILIG